MDIFKSAGVCADSGIDVESVSCCLSEQVPQCIFGSEFMSGCIGQFQLCIMFYCALPAGASRVVLIKEEGTGSLL